MLTTTYSHLCHYIWTSLSISVNCFLIVRLDIVHSYLISLILVVCLACSNTMDSNNYQENGEEEQHQ